MNAYLITNSVNGKRYIGVSMDARRRWRHHRYIAKTRPKQALHYALGKHGVSNFSFEIIASATSWADLMQLEQILIAQYATVAGLGHGYNLTGGGDGALGYKHTPEYIARQTGRIVSQETRDRMRAVNIGKHITPEHIEILRLVNSSRVRTQAERDAIGARSRGRPVSAETRAKQRTAKLGKPMAETVHAKLIASRADPAYRAAMSEKKTGVKLSPEHAAKAATVWCGRSHTLETRLKMSVSAKASIAARRAAKAVT